MDTKKSNFKFNNLPPFKWFVLQNFPFIEEDFDALTNWELFCKLGGKINEVIKSQNLVGKQAEDLTNAYNELETYVNNYFDKLDVQDEINKKLDKMASDGTLDKIINQEVFGEINQKITKNTNDIAKNTTNITTNTNNISKNTNAISKLEAKKTMIVIGDSFSNSAQSGTPLWYTYVANALNLNVYTTASDGQGFGTGNNNFLVQLQNANSHFTDKTVIDRIYILGGLNDLGNTAGLPTSSDFESAIDQVFNYATSNFANIPIYVYGILPFQFYNWYGGSNYLTNNRASIFNEILSYVCMQYVNKNIFFSSMASFGLFTPDYFGNENSSKQRHPSAKGEKLIANCILTGQRFIGIRGINNNNQCPSLSTSIPVVEGTASKVSIIGVDLNNFYIKIEGYDNTKTLRLNLQNLPIETNNSSQYDYVITDEYTTILLYGRNGTMELPTGRLKSGIIYLNVPYNILW